MRHPQPAAAGGVSVKRTVFVTSWILNQLHQTSPNFIPAYIRVRVPRRNTLLRQPHSTPAPAPACVQLRPFPFRPLGATLGANIPLSCARFCAWSRRCR